MAPPPSRKGGLSSPLSSTSRTCRAEPSSSIVRWTGGNARDAQKVTSWAPPGTRPSSWAVRPKTVGLGNPATVAGSNARSGKPTSNGAGTPAKRTRTRLASSPRRSAARASRSFGFLARIAPTAARASAFASRPRARASRWQVRSARNVPSARTTSRAPVKARSWARAGAVARKRTPVDTRMGRRGNRKVNARSPQVRLSLREGMPGAMPAETRSDALLVQLAELHRARKTGCLMVARGAQCLVVDLRQGQITGVAFESFAGPGATEGPGEPLVLDGLDLAGDPGLAREAARERLLMALTWTDVSSTFTEGPQDGEDPPLTLFTEAVLGWALPLIKDPEVIRATLGDVDRVLGLTFDPSKAKNLSLTPTEGYILSRIDGILSAREVLQLIPTDPVETERSLFRLLLGGLVEYLALPGRPAVPTPDMAPPLDLDLRLGVDETPPVAAAPAPRAAGEGSRLSPPVLAAARGAGLEPDDERSEERPPNSRARAIRSTQRGDRRLERAGAARTGERGRHRPSGNGGPDPGRASYEGRAVLGCHSSPRGRGHVLHGKAPPEGAAAAGPGLRQEPEVATARRGGRPESHHGHPQEPRGVLRPRGNLQGRGPRESGHGHVSQGARAQARPRGRAGGARGDRRKGLRDALEASLPEALEPPPQ